jgi:hypothetical protein
MISPSSQINAKTIPQSFSKPQQTSTLTSTNLLTTPKTTPEQSHMEQSQNPSSSLQSPTIGITPTTIAPPTPLSPIPYTIDTTQLSIRNFFEPTERTPTSQHPPTHNDLYIHKSTITHPTHRPHQPPTTSHPVQAPSPTPRTGIPTTTDPMLKPNPINGTISTQNYHTSGLSSLTLSFTNTDAMSAANELGEIKSSVLKRKSKRMSMPIKESEHPKRSKCDMSEKCGGRVTPDNVGKLKKGVGRETREVGNQLAKDGQFDVG